MIVVGVLGSIVWFVSLFGFIVNGPNQVARGAAVRQVRRHVRETGFFYGNPFYWRDAGEPARADVRDRDEQDRRAKDAAGHVIAAGEPHREPLKVNDRDGTPIEIAAVVVWRVVNPAEAVFQVDNYEEFVEMQADAALRNLASRYSYDAPDGGRALAPRAHRGGRRSS